MKKRNLKPILFFSVLLFSQFTFAKTGEVAAGFDLIVNYLTVFFSTVKGIAYLIGAVIIIFKLLEAKTGGQYNQIIKEIFIVVLAMGVIFSIDKVLKAIGGKTLGEKYKIEIVQKYDKKGDDDICKKIKLID